jgi:hypothetical protein
MQKSPKIDKAHYPLRPDHEIQQSQENESRNCLSKVSKLFQIRECIVKTKYQKGVENHENQD